MYMLHYESRASTCCTTNHICCYPATSKSIIFSHYFEKIGKTTAATSAISMTSLDRMVAPRQNHREGTRSRASKIHTGWALADKQPMPHTCAHQLLKGHADPRFAPPYEAAAVTCTSGRKLQHKALGN